MEEQPENIRRDSVCKAVQKAPDCAQTELGSQPVPLPRSPRPHALQPETSATGAATAAGPAGNGDAGSERRRSTWGKFPGCQCKAEVSSSRLTIQPLSVWGAALAVPVPQTIVCAPPRNRSGDCGSGPSRASQRVCLRPDRPDPTPFETAGRAGH